MITFLILIGIEIVQVAVSLRCARLTRKRLCAARKDQRDHAAAGFNGRDGAILRIRARRYLRWWTFHCVFVLGGLIIVYVRLKTLVVPMLVTSTTRDFQVLIGTLLVYMMMIEYEEDTQEINTIDERIVKRAELAKELALKQEALKTSVDEVNLKLDEMKDQSHTDRTKGTEVEIKIKAGVTDANVKLDDMKVVVENKI